MSDEPVIVRLARMEEKLDRILTHEDRISALERWKSYASGVVATIVLILGWVVFK